MAAELCGGERKRGKRKKVFLFNSLFTTKKQNEKNFKKKIKNRRPLDVGPYLKHLARKYGPLYGLPEGRAEELVAPGLQLASEALERAKKR